MHQLVSNYFFQLRAFAFVSSQFNPITVTTTFISTFKSVSKEEFSSSSSRFVSIKKSRNDKSTQIGPSIFPTFHNDRFKLHEERFYH